MKCLTIIFLLLGCSVYSQKPSCSCSFQSILSAGLAAGSSAAKPILQGSAGSRFNKYFVGIGAGIDAYRFNTIPLFADLRRDFGKKNTLFIYSQGGYSIPYNNESARDWFSMPRSLDKFRGGFYMDAGVGYRMYIKGSHRILISTGYSYKRVNNIVGYSHPCITGPCPDEVYEYQYSLGRIVMKVGWEFNKLKGKN